MTKDQALTVGAQDLFRKGKALFTDELRKTVSEIFRNKISIKKQIKKENPAWILTSKRVFFRQG